MTYDFDIDTRRALNRLCREQMKKRIMSDVLADLTVCQLEGWSRTEYIDELIAMLYAMKGGSDERPEN